jgi:hypothetical protein
MNRVINEDINKWGDGLATFAVSNDKYCLSKELVNESNSWCIDSSSYVASGVCDKTEIKCVQNIVNNPVPVEPSTSPQTEPTTPVVITPPVNDVNMEKKELINQLKSALDKQKTDKGTYLGVVSSKTGIDLVKQINENEEKDPMNIYTSKEKYCAMKKFTDGVYYCVDSTGFAGESSDCNNKTFTCKVEIAQ